MDIRIDLGRCQGHARCLENAPQVFGYNDVTNQAFVLDAANLDSDRDGVLRAVSDCPEMAISVGDNVVATKP
jgi:ferredoxin